MHVVLTGATGFIGRALLLRLARDGHQLTAWVRDPVRARALLGPDVALIDARDPAALRAAVGTADAVINLAGEAIAGKRWTRARKAALTGSRLGPTAAVVEAIAAAAATGRAPVLVSASAIGIYGDRGDARLAEMALPGEGFAAELCRAWEAAALAARGAASRVALLRFGIVLGREGGALAKLAPLTNVGLGGPIAGGEQWMAWIHLADAVEAIVFALGASALEGPVNVVAPEPVRQRGFAQALGRALGRPAVTPAPGFALRLLLGEAASVLTASQRVVPDALVAAGFTFAFGALDGALADLTSSAGIGMRRLQRGEAPDTDYTRARHPRYVLVAQTELAAPLSEVFPFFASAENLQLLTPPQMAFRIETPWPVVTAPGVTIDYRLRILGIPARWRTVIERWRTPEAGDREAVFVDAQHRGPYRAWWHEHHFYARGDRTLMEDVVYYAPPLGPLGALANRWVVAGQLRKIFGYRAAMIRERFGAGASS